jgi:hypothetical protein
MRNLLIAHTKAYAAMKAKNQFLTIGITHQWLKFLPISSNPLEKIVAFFYTSLIHTPIFEFFKNGVMHVKIPFRANVQLRDERGGKVSDFLGVQAYGFPRIKIGFTRGVFYPGAADKVKNFILPFFKLGFTIGSTCEEGGSMQYFGPPCKPNDLVDVLQEAFSIPRDRVTDIGITETGSDAKRMDFGERDIKIDNEAQARFGLRTEFDYLVNVHQDLHSLGQTAVSLHAKGESEAALALLPEIQRLRDLVLTELKVVLEEKGVS